MENRKIVILGAGHVGTHCALSLMFRALANEIVLIDTDEEKAKSQVLDLDDMGACIPATEPVSSPTFTIVQVYEEGRLPFYHFDVYRIGDIEEMEEIGYDDYFFGNGICLIEWAELIEEILPDNVISITIEKDLTQGFDYRKITVDGL